MAKKSHSQRKSRSDPVSSVSEEEQWRLINETGVLHRIVPATSPIQPGAGEDHQEVPILDAMMLIVPLSACYVGLDIMIHQQYAQHPTVRDELGRCATVLPILAGFIYYTYPRKSQRWMQLVLAALSVASGPRLIYHMNKSSWLVVMRQAPPLATIWIYTIVALDLLAAVASLAAVALWVWWKNMKIVI